jgi:ATP-binding cassette subfamily B protein
MSGGAAGRGANWDGVAWPVERLGAAIAALAGRGRAGAVTEADAPIAPGAALDRDDLGRRIETLAARAGFEAVEAEAPYRLLAAFLSDSPPAVVVLPRPGGARVLVVIGRRGEALRVLAPDLRPRLVDREEVRAALSEEWEAPLRPRLESLLGRLGIASRADERVVAALLAEQLHGIAIGGVWTLRPAAGGPLRRLAFAHRVPGRLATLLAAHAGQYVLWLVAWAVIGGGALRGALHTNALVTWGLLLLALLPLRWLAAWAEGAASIGAGALLKERLMLGAVRLRPEEVRHLGAGQHLSRVIESEAVELLGVTGGLLALTATLELAGAFWVMAHGAAAASLLVLLAGWLVVTALVAVRLHRARLGWTRARLDLTHLLVERMAGHETRLAQQLPERWFDGEDDAVAAYVERSRRFDRLESAWSVALTRGWLVVGLLGLAPALVAGAPAERLAIGLGGILLAYQALARWTAGLGNLIGAWISWEQVRDLFAAAARREPLGTPAALRGPGEAAERPGAPLVVGRDVSFRYDERRPPALADCTFSIASGDRILLEGPSGAGKSTLVSLLSGLRVPTGGSLRVLGLGLEVLGREGWRRRVAAAPQFHENHVFSASLAFNLLMGRRWPPRHEDVADAERLCGELGIGELIARMPGGIHQMVGETGWQLSHGERSRVFLARALLQGGSLLVLDESFGALDPETLQANMTCVLKQSAALMVVGHV